MITTEVKIVADFISCDPMGVVWNGKYFDFFEIGRRELFRSVGLSYKTMSDEGFMLPLVRNKIKYIRPMRFEDEATLSLNVVEYEYLLRIKYEIRGMDGTLLTKGESEQMATDLEGKAFSPLPESLRNALEKLGKEDV